jgi:carboxypeptidase Q
MRPITLSVLLFGLSAVPAKAQNFPTNDARIRAIWNEGMTNSRVYDFAQTLSDSIGPRLTGTPGIKAGNDWLVATYRSLGVPARNEQYGTWKGWRRGVTHLDLIAPRVRTLEATMLAWSPGTSGPVEGTVVIVPDVANADAFNAWLPQVSGKFVLISRPEATCRPDSNWQEFGTPESFERMQHERNVARDAWTKRIQRTGLTTRDLPVKLEQAGARAVLTSNWSAGWGVTKIFNARTERVPTLDLSCEDYGLVYRLAERNQAPALRLNATAEMMGEVPVFNTIAEIKGSEKPNEYIVLSAHFDSWDGGSGTTDNGTGTITMLEALRILNTVYPNPKRTIVVGHWSGEEQGLNGSRAFAADHPEIVKGLQALFNQDNGTGRISNISMQGLVNAGGFFARWLSQIPSEITQHIRLTVPGAPGSGGSDYAAFICYGAPAFSLSATSWEYGTYTWHTNRDTFDKVVLDDLRNNAVLTAMLAYLASEDSQTVPRDQRVFGPARPVSAVPQPGSQQPAGWPACATPARTSAQSTR